VTLLTAKKKRISRAVGKQWKRVKRAKSAVDTRTTDRSLHQLRKAVKRYRYSLEALGKPVKRLKKVQQVLGEHQDSVVSRIELRTLGVRTHLSGENGFTFGLLHGLERCDAERARAMLPKAWRRVR
jgi:CHAD domain-containing protein